MYSPTQTDPEMAELEAARLLEDARREVARLEVATELEAATGSLESEAEEAGPPEVAEPDLAIAQAEAAGRWLEAGQMKLRAKLEGEPSPEPREESEGESIENLMAQVADAEINRDFYASGVAKVRLMNMKAAQDPLNAYGVDVAPSPTSDQDQDLERRIHDAESRGDWGESLRLKGRRIPGIGPSL